MLLYWTDGLNLIEQERLEQPMRQLGLPKEMVQGVSLLLGIRPGWTVLATGESAFRLRLSGWLLKGLVAAALILELVLGMAAWGWRLTRNRAYR